MSDAKTIQDIGDLQPDPDNANLGTERGLQMLDDSLREDGAGRSILVDRDGVTIAGAKTLERAADIGLPIRVVQTDGTELVVVQRTDLDLSGKGEAQVRARRMAYRDNRSSEVGLVWNPDQLLADLESGFDFDGLFGDEELAEVLAGLVVEETPEDPGARMSEADRLQEVWGTTLGQVWELDSGKGHVHRLAVGDCTDRAVVEAVMRGERAGAVVTDPPYGIEREGILNDDPEGLQELYDNCLATMPIDDAVVIAFQSPRLFWVWLDAVRDAGHKVERMLWMYKPNDETFPWRGWLLKSEAILISSFRGGQWLDVHPYHHDYYECMWGKPEVPRGAHASVKPLAVVQDLISRVGGDVYDPFLGSGTAVVACERLGRKARAIELDPGYCGVAIQRWADLTNGEPRLLV